MIKLTSSQIAAPRSAREDLWSRRLNLSQMSGVVTVAINEFRSILTKNLQFSGDSEIAETKSTLIREVSGMLGFDNALTSLILSGGTEANRAAMHLAMKKSRKVKVISSSLSHSSVSSSAKQLGASLISVEARPELGFQMESSELRRAIEENSEDIAMLHLTAGQTDLGIVEKLDPEIALLCKRLGIWIHVDAAYGGFNIGLLPQDLESSNQLNSLIHSESVNSITVDPHKFVGPYGVGMLLLPGCNPESMGAEFSYFENNAKTLEPSTFPAFNVAVAVKEIEFRGREGLMKLAANNSATAHSLKHKLHSYGVRLIMPNNITSMVQVELESESQTREVVSLLKNEGIFVASINIKGSDYELNGIRLVIRPDTRYDNSTLQMVAFKIKRAIEISKGNKFYSPVVYTDLFGSLTEEDMFYRTMGE